MTKGSKTSSEVCYQLVKELQVEANTTFSFDSKADSVAFILATESFSPFLLKLSVMNYVRII